MGGFEVVDGVMGRHNGGLPLWWPPLAALMARLLPGARAGAAPRSAATRPEQSGGRRGAFILLRDAKRPSSGRGGK